MTRVTASRIPVHALIDDLFFRSKLEATAGALDMPVVISRSPGELSERLDALAGGVATVLIDLGHIAADPPAVIRALKARPNAPLVIAFGAHGDATALRAAREAGADRVLARSAFTDRLPDLLREAAG